jgi:hypothetical protein
MALLVKALQVAALLAAAPEDLPGVHLEGLA